MQRRAFCHSAMAAAAVSSLAPLDAFGAVYRVVAAGAAGLRDVRAVSGDGSPLTLRGADIAELAAAIRGRVLLPDDEGYAEARLIRNPSFDRHPALIVQVTGATDVRAAVDFARDHGGVLLAVKCGGHSYSGASTCDDGMMIDLSPFRHVRVDPGARRAWVSGGSLLGQVDHETMAHGLVTTLGTVSHTGVGGLVTSGGFGRLGRRFGLSVDNLESVQVVTADGRLLRASADENEDLFWGVRGGGGNFGVVTSFEFRLHPMQREVIAGKLRFPLGRAADVLARFGEYAEHAPDALQMDLTVLLPPGGADGLVDLSVCWSGAEREAEKALAPLRKLGTPLSDDIGPIDYVVLQRSADNDDPRALGIYLRSGFVAGINPELRTAIADRLEGHPERTTVISFQQGGGAIARVPTDATAFPQRDALANMMGVTGWRHGQADADVHMDYMRGFWNAELARHAHGFYVADAAPDATAAEIRANYRRNHERMVAVKNRYDPHNLFRLNANVAPTAEPAEPGSPAVARRAGPPA